MSFSSSALQQMKDICNKSPPEMQSVLSFRKECNEWHIDELQAPESTSHMQAAKVNSKQQHQKEANRAFQQLVHSMLARYI